LEDIVDKFVVVGGEPLKGEICVRAAKNALLPCLAASLLTSEKIIFERTSLLVDIFSMVSLLEHLGVRIEGNIGGTLALKADDISSLVAPYDLVRKMRASVLVLGPLLSRFKKARVSLPGGCAIGARPVDQHIKGLKALGAEIDYEEGYIVAKCDELKGGDVFFDKVTVGGTQNILMAAVLAKGRTTIANAAREPEVVDLGNLLIKMGARIEGLGTDRIVVEGVDELKGCSHNPIPDRIECGTFLAAAAATKGKIKVKECNPNHLEAFLMKLEEMGYEVALGENSIFLDGEKEVNSVDITTSPYPGFPTDLQAQFVSLLTQAVGTATVREEIFETRFMHIPELQRLGADIKLEGNAAVIKGKTALKGAPVMASDLRASASLVIAGLVAKGKTTINRIYHLDRGYEKFEERLQSLGARIERIK
jgi:UDP-N-acetylglucosamine 1-carboxyvinyltransferase